MLKNEYLSIRFLYLQITLVILTIGTKVPSDLILPSISTGAIAGRFIGIITEQIAYKSQHFPLVRREYGVSNEHLYYTWTLCCC
jgi:H+/Cl- antiporter ClcA